MVQMENSGTDVQVTSQFDDVIEGSLEYKYWGIMQTRNERGMNKGSSRGDGENGTELKGALKLDTVRLVLNWFNIRKIHCSH